jgi:hypothetical protein
MPLKIENSADRRTADKIVLYSEEGMGKSSWAAGAHKPLFANVRGEKGIAELGVPSVYIDTVEDLYAMIKEFPHETYRTFVMDSGSAMQLIFQEYVIAKYKWKQGMETLDYGKCWQRTYEIWDRVKNKLEMLADKHDVEIILLFHARIKDIEKPDSGNYGQHTLNLKDKCSIPMKQWASVVFFADYEQIVETKGENIAKLNERGKVKVSGKRVIYTTKHPARDAKNRYHLPPVIPLTNDDGSSCYSFFDQWREKFWADRKAGKAPEQTPTPTPEPSDAPAEEVKITKKSVNQLLKKWMDDNDVTNIQEVKDKFVVPHGVGAVAKASQEQLGLITAAVLATYEGE